MNDVDVFFSVNALITCLSVNKLLFMSIDSLLACYPVNDCLSLPAKSTS
jgi:hypothetical protein